MSVLLSEIAMYTRRPQGVNYRVYLHVLEYLFIIVILKTNTLADVCPRQFFKNVTVRHLKWVNEYQLSGWVIIINGDGGCNFWQPVQADSQPKSSGLVWRLTAAWRRSTFIKWTGWTLAMALPWWQHHKHCLGYYYYYYYLQPIRLHHSFLLNYNNNK